jgi:replicative DNA helicase
MNKITKGGLPKKSLNVIMAGTGVGKSLFMCHCAGANLSAGLNVLYITLEMAEERIAERIDANLLDVEVVQLPTLKRDQYLSHIDSIRNKTAGKLIVKEYPTAVAHVGHFRHLLNELNLKKSFRPDIVYVDYLNICSSSRIKPNANANSYTLVKSIAEELRGLAVENNIPVVTATQTNRQGFTNSDVDLTDTAESFGLPATADFMVALISNDEMEELGQLLVKQLKNRYNDPTKYRRFVVGVDRDKMRVYDAEDSAQDDLFDSPNDDDDDNSFFSGSIGASDVSRRFEGVI